ncbi:MAG TPA: sigma-70 family RNA polymerase sigma factor [Burkholderiaceae bacterium]
MTIAELPTVQHETDMEEYWSAWRRCGDQGARDRLIEHYLPFARVLAGKLYRDRASREFEFDDYLQYATIGLIDSLDRYDPAGEASFKTYASLRITGEMVDGVRTLSEKQEQISIFKRLQAERSESLADGGDGRDAFEQLAAIAVGLALGHILDNTGHEDDTAVPDNQYQGIELRQLRDYLQTLVEKLPERERLVIKYNYFNHVPFESIATQWGMTRGRIAQLHRSALERLRKSAAALRHYDMTW